MGCIPRQPTLPWKLEQPNDFARPRLSSGDHVQRRGGVVLIGKGRGRIATGGGAVGRLGRRAGSNGRRALQTTPQISLSCPSALLVLSVLTRHNTFRADLAAVLISLTNRYSSTRRRRPTGSSAVSLPPANSELACFQTLENTRAGPRPGDRNTKRARRLLTADCLSYTGTLLSSEFKSINAHPSPLPLRLARHVAPVHPQLSRHACGPGKV